MKIKDLKVGECFTYDKLEGTFKKKIHDFSGYCIVGDVTIPGDVFAIEWDTDVTPV